MPVTIPAFQRGEARSFRDRMNASNLHEISRIGFGGYRISRHFREHYDALQHALDNGCNLIDTAATYSNGESEQLIGEVLASRNGPCPFLVTKAGYVQGNSLSLMESLNKSGRACEDIVRTRDGSVHSIHPDFLRAQIQHSLRRLGRPVLDGFLLHNPEYYFEQADGTVTSAEYYSRIQKAFEFLEEQVTRGLIRFYGVSSNTLPLPPDAAQATSLVQLIAIAARITEKNHFRLIQFPMNFIEDDAQRRHHDGRSLLELAREYGIKTLVNRPLNANSLSGPIRLATYEEVSSHELEEQSNQDVVDECLDILRRRLFELEIDDDLMNFAPAQIIAVGWKQFGNPDVVDQFFEMRLQPFIAKLWEDGVHPRVLAPFSELRRVLLLRARRNMDRAARAFRLRMIEAGKIRSNDSRPLAFIACESYLASGADHVLVGMRNIQYVDTFKDLFGGSK